MSEPFSTGFLGPLNESVETVFNDENGQPHHLRSNSRAQRNLVQFGFIPQERVWIEAPVGRPVEYVRFNLFLDPNI
jgi:hypothetical protein